MTTTVVGDSGWTVEVDEENVAVSVGAPGLTDASLELNAKLAGATLRTVKDHAGTGSALQVSEAAAKVDGTITVDSVQLDVAAGASTLAEGELSWNAAEKTANLGLGHPALQIGLESMAIVYNNTGVQIEDGEVVSIESDATGGDVHGVLADATIRNSARATIGIATEPIAAGTTGKVTVFGKVRGIDTSDYTVGDPIFLHASTPGAFQTSPPPFPPVSAVFLGVVAVADADSGVIWLNPAAPPALTELVDVSVSGPVTGELLVYNASASVFENKTPSMTTKVPLSMHTDKPTRGKELSQFGGLEKLVDNDALDSGTPLAFTNGCGKIALAALAGSDATGDILLTGDTVDRNTGAVTPGDTETVSISGLTTDGSTADAEGNLRHAFTKLYLTTKWFQGAVTATTADVTLTDVDIYNIAFFQFGDTPTAAELDTFEVAAIATSTSAWLYGYMYSVEVQDGWCSIVREASAELPTSAIDAAGAFYKRKLGEIGKALTPATDGFWVDIFPGPFNQTYWENLTTMVIYSATSPLTLS